MTEQSPTVGRVVHYTLNEQDVDTIIAERMSDNGARGNVVHEGHTAPAIIVRVWESDHAGVQLQVFLDGNHTHWATSRVEGDRPGQWAWPARS